MKVKLVRKIINWLQNIWCLTFEIIEWDINKLKPWKAIYFNTEEWKKWYSLFEIDKENNTFKIYIKDKANWAWFSSFLIKDNWAQIYSTFDISDESYWNTECSTNNNKLVFISIWTWIVPHIAIINKILKENIKFKKIILINWEKSEKEYLTCLLDKFSVFKNKWIKVINIYSQEWEKTHVQDILKNNNVWIENDDTIYICWNNEFVNSIEEQVRQKFDNNKIYKN